MLCKIFNFFKKFSLPIIILLLIYAFVLINKDHKIIETGPLKGAFEKTASPVFTTANWFSGEYQSVEEKYLNENFYWRSFFIRVNNQLQFNLFNKAVANGVLIGKDNYLYEEYQITSYYGKDLLTTEALIERFKMLKLIQDTLESKGKTFLVVYNIGKGSFFPDNFPEQLISEKGATNYQNHIKYSEEYGINYIDFQKYFLEKKGHSEYPLFPEYGTHWSVYGAFLAADSLLKKLEQMRKIDLPDPYYDDIDVSQADNGDYDIAEGMNLLFRLRGKNMAYPKIKYNTDKKVRPTALVISDSFYWSMYDITTNCFGPNHFWFYNYEIYPENKLKTSEINLAEEINKHDIVIIMATEPNLKKLGWGFIENCYKLYTLGEGKTKLEFQKKIQEVKKGMRSNPEFMKLIKEKALKNNISIDSMMTLDAIWIINH